MSTDSTAVTTATSWESTTSSATRTSTPTTTQPGIAVSPTGTPTPVPTWIFVERSNWTPMPAAVAGSTQDTQTAQCKDTFGSLLDQRRYSMRGGRSYYLSGTRNLTMFTLQGLVSSRGGQSLVSTDIPIFTYGDSGEHQTPYMWIPNESGTCAYVQLAATLQNPPRDPERPPPAFMQMSNSNVEMGVINAQRIGNLDDGSSSSASASSGGGSSSTTGTESHGSSDIGTTSEVQMTPDPTLSLSSAYDGIPAPYPHTTHGEMSNSRSPSDGLPSPGFQDSLPSSSGGQSGKRVVISAAVLAPLAAIAALSFGLFWIRRRRRRRGTPSFEWEQTNAVDPFRYPEPTVSQTALPSRPLHGTKRRPPEALTPELLSTLQSTGLSLQDLISVVRNTAVPTSSIIAVRSDVHRRYFPTTEAYSSTGETLNHASLEAEQVHPRRLDSFHDVDGANDDMNSAMEELVVAMRNAGMTAHNLVGILRGLSQQEITGNLGAVVDSRFPLYDRPMR